MYDEDDEFLRGIPAFLRRFEAPPPRKLPVRPGDLAAPQPQAAPQSQPQAAPQPASQPAPQPAPTSTAAPAAPKVVDMVQPAAAEAPAAQRARIALAFENRDLAEDGDDVAFQVTLPRGVVRQIRMLAAEKDTTPRAVVLRALRLAGLSVPDGSDIDRRGRTAKRRSQA